MSRVSTKRKHPKKWVLTWCRPVGEFDDKGERRFEKMERFPPVAYRTNKLARKAQCRAWHSHRTAIYGLIHKLGERPKKVVEIRVFDKEDGSYLPE